MAALVGNAAQALTWAALIAIAVHEYRNRSKEHTP